MQRNAEMRGMPYISITRGPCRIQIQIMPILVPCPITDYLIHYPRSSDFGPAGWPEEPDGRASGHSARPPAPPMAGREGEAAKRPDGDATFEVALERGGDEAWGFALSV